MPDSAMADGGGGRRRRVSVLLQDVVGGWPAPQLTLGELADELDERAFGVLLVILALPGCIPGVPLLPSLFGVPMALISLQLVRGRHSPVLPAFARNRAFSRDRFADLLRRIVPWMHRFEAVARPRLPWMLTRRAERLIGAACLVLSLSVCAPLPTTNTLPSIAVAIIGLGLIELDGLLVIAGLFFGLFALAVVAAVYGGAIAALLLVL